MAVAVRRGVVMSRMILLGTMLLLSSPGRADEAMDYQNDRLNGDAQEMCVAIPDVQSVLQGMMDELAAAQEAKMGARYAKPIAVFYMDWEMAAKYPGDDPAETLNPNAMAIGPGVLPNRDASRAKVIVMAGMLDYIGKTSDQGLNPKETKFVLGHELGHLQLKHTEQIRDCKRDKFIPKQGGKSDFDAWMTREWERIKDLDENQTVNKFFKDVCSIDLYKNEEDADAFAQKLLGYALAGQVVFERVAKHNPEAAKGDDDHPSLESRIKKMDDRFQKAYVYKDEALKGADKKDGKKGAKKDTGCMSTGKVKGGLKKAGGAASRIPAGLP